MQNIQWLGRRRAHDAGCFDVEDKRPGRRRRPAGLEHSGGPALWHIRSFNARRVPAKGYRPLTPAGVKKALTGPRLESTEGVSGRRGLRGATKAPLTDWKP